MKYTNQKMYNGRMITNTINKPLLHKKGKQWIVVGLSALMLAGFGGAVDLGRSTVHVNASTVQTGINKTLAQNNQQNSSASNNPQASASASSNNSQISNSSASASSTSTSNITDQAKAMHANLLAKTATNNDMNTLNLGTPAQQKRGWNFVQAGVNGHDYDNSNDNQTNSSNKQETVASEPEVGNAQQTPQFAEVSSNEVGDTINDWQYSNQAYDGLNYRYSPSNKMVEFTNGILTWTNPNNEYSDSKAFIGDKVANVPSNLKNATTIQFDNGVDIPNLSNSGNNRGNAQLSSFIAGNSNVEKIIFGSHLADYKVNKQNETIGKGMFASDSHLKYLQVPNGWFSYGDFYSDTNPNALKYDSDLSEINILPSPSAYNTYKTSIYDNKVDGANARISMGLPKTAPIYNTVVNKPLAPGDYKPVSDKHIDNNSNVDTGNYYGLNFNYNKDTKTVEFTSGTLNGWNYRNGYYSSAFLGDQTNAPTDLKNAEHVKFDNAIQIKASQNLAGFIQDDNNLKSVDLGPSFIDNAIKGYAANKMNGMFQSDYNLESIALPYDLVSNDSASNYAYDNATSLFTSDKHLNKITIYSPDTRILSGATMNFGSNPASDNPAFNGTWYKLQNGTTSSPISLINTNIQPGTYITHPLNYDHEGTARVKFDTTHHIISVSDGTLVGANEGNNNRYQEFMSDIKDGNGDPVTSLPDNSNQWIIKFNNVTAPSDMAFVFSGGINGSNNQNALGKQVKEIDLSGLDTSNVTNMQGMLMNCDNLQKVDFSNLDGSKPIDTSNVNNMSMMLGSDKALNHVDLSNLSGLNLQQAWDLFDNDPALSDVKLSSKFSPLVGSNNYNADLSEMFASDAKLPFNGINWNNFNTKHVANFYGMFRNDSKLGDVHLPGSFDTSHGVNFGTNVHIPSDNTDKNDGAYRSPGSKYNNYNKDASDGMFQSDLGTSDIDLGPSFDTSNAKSMQGMFSADKNLNQIEFGNEFNTHNVTNMKRMFGFSDAFKNGLTLPSTFDTSSVTDDTGMFESDIVKNSSKYSGKLKSLTITSPNTILAKGNDTRDGRLGVSGDTVWDSPQNPVYLYKETGELDSNQKPTTVSSPNDFTQGNIGTFTHKNLASDHDLIQFETKNGQFVADEVVTGKDGTPETVNPNQVPKGYQLVNDDTQFTLGKKSNSNDFIYNNQIVHVVTVKSNTNNQIPLSDNVANVNGTIDLHFIDAQNNEHIVQLHYHKQMTANDSGVDLLSLSSDIPSDIHVTKPSDYNNALNSLVNGLDTKNYSYNSSNTSNTSNANSTGNNASDYMSYKITPSDAKYYNNSTKMFTGPTLNFYFNANTATNRIKLVDNNGNIVPVASNNDRSNNSEADLGGLYGSNDNTSQAVSADIPSNYSLNSNNPSSLTINNGSDIIHVSRKQATDPITYEYSGSPKGSSASVTGNMNSDITPNSDNMPNVPSGYHVVPGQSSFAFNGSSESVNVAPNTAHELIEYYYTQNNHNTLVGTQLMQGTVSESSAISSGNDHNYNQSASGYGLNNGYALQSSSNPFTFSDGETVVPVKLSSDNSSTDKTYISFITPEGNDGTATNVGQAIVSDKGKNASDRITMDDIKGQLNGHYHIVNNTDTIPYDNQPHDVIVAPNQVSETIQYQINGRHISDSSDKQTFTVNGLYNTPGHIDGQNIPSDYRLANDGSQDFTFSDSGQTHYVDVLENTHADSITFVNQHGVVVGHYTTKDGKAGTKLSGTNPANNSDKVSSHMPDGYTDSNTNDPTVVDANNTDANISDLTYDGLNHVVRVQGNTITQNNGNVITKNSSGSNKPANMAYYATIIAHEKGANGSDANDSTYYVPVKGRVGDTFSLEPTEINHSGYDIAPSDITYTGNITPDGITGLPTNNQINWTYTTPSADNRSTLVYYHLNSDNGYVLNSGASDESGSSTEVGTKIDVSKIASVPSGYHLVHVSGDSLTDNSNVNNIINNNNISDNDGYTVQNGQQILNFVVQPDNINKLSDNAQKQSVHVTTIFKNNGNVVHTMESDIPINKLPLLNSHNNSDVWEVGQTYIINPPADNKYYSGYTSDSGNKPLIGVITPNGVSHASITFVYDGVNKNTHINLKYPDGSNYGGGYSDTDVQPGDRVTVPSDKLPNGYHVIPGQNPTIPSDQRDVSVKIAPNDVSSYVTLTRVYEFGSDQVKVIADQPIPINLEPTPGQSDPSTTIIPNDPNFVNYMPGYTPTSSDQPWTIHYQSDPIAYTYMNKVFTYKATPIDIQVQYRNVDDKTSQHPNGAIVGTTDLGNVGVDGQQIDVNADNPTQIGTITGQGIYTKNGTPVTFDVPKGYHLQNANNIITVEPQTDGNGNIQTDSQGQPMMLLSLDLGASAPTPASSSNSTPNKPAQPASNNGSHASSSNSVPSQPNRPASSSSSSASSSNNVPNVPASNNSGHSNSASSANGNKPASSGDNSSNGSKASSSNSLPNQPNRPASSNSFSASSSNNVPNTPASNNSGHSNSASSANSNKPASSGSNGSNGSKANSSNSLPNQPSQPASNGSKSASSAGNGGSVAPSNHGSDNSSHTSQPSSSANPSKSSSSASNSTPSQPNRPASSANSNNGSNPASNGGSVSSSSNNQPTPPAGSSSNPTNNVPNNPASNNNANSANNGFQLPDVDTVNFVYNGNTVGTTVKTGQPGSLFSVASDVPAGYVANANPVFNFDGSTHQIQLRKFSDNTPAPAPSPVIPSTPSSSSNHNDASQSANSVSSSSSASHSASEPVNKPSASKPKHQRHIHSYVANHHSSHQSVVPSDGDPASVTGKTTNDRPNGSVAHRQTTSGVHTAAPLMINGDGSVTRSNGNARLGSTLNSKSDVKPKAKLDQLNHTDRKGGRLPQTGENDSSKAALAEMLGTISTMLVAADAIIRKRRDE